MKNNNNIYLHTIFAIIGFVFLKSSFGKLTGGKFVSTLGGTLAKFASENPYPWFKELLLNTAIPNAQVFGLLVMWGEFFAGLIIFALSIYLVLKTKAAKELYLLLAIGLAIGAFLNLNFLLAAGWTSPSTESLNFIMFLVQAVGVIYAGQKYTSSK